MDITRIFLVGVGGFLGSVVRYIAVKAVDVRINQSFPYGTMAVNVIGCLLIGVVVGIVGRHQPGSENLRAFMGAGFCGGFTTFSAFALENQNLIAERMAAMAIVYVLGSVMAGIVAVFIGLWLARFL